MVHSRRAFLKCLAAAPVVLIAGAAVSPILRYLKPTMAPLDFFCAADFPTSDSKIEFRSADFPDVWTCLPFMYPMQVKEFNPELKEVRDIWAFIIRCPNNELVAYSRDCPLHWYSHKCPLNFLSDASICHCGCFQKLEKCSNPVTNPVLYCACTGTSFDLANDGNVIGSTVTKRPKKFKLKKQNDVITIEDLEIDCVV